MKTIEFGAKSRHAGDNKDTRGYSEAVLGGVDMRKFMVAFDQRVFSDLERVAKSRNISVQELLRAIVVPEWFRNENRARLVET